MLKDQIKDATCSTQDLTEKITTLKSNVESLQARKQTMLHSVQVYQKLHKRYTDLRDQKYVYIQPNAESRQTDIEKMESRLNKINHMMGNLGNKDVLGEYGLFVNESRKELLAI
jgi:predicted RNase H-like nuclease (RuvC/YqgF family)